MKTMPAVALTILALTLVFSVPAAAGADAAAAGPSVRLRAMTFNIFYGGDEWDLQTGRWCTKPEGCQETLDQVIETIRAGGPDVVGLQEATMNTSRIAERLGWHASERMQIISRYPLIDPPGGDSIYIFVEPVPGRVAALANVHLPSDPYGPYLVRDGATLEEVLALERSVRLPAIQTQIRVLPPLAARGIPVFLSGDFNSPSHLDWTEAVMAVRDVVRYPVVWPVSKALADAGFRDPFREVYPDPVARPGFTWTPGGLESIPNEVYDRIDWVLAAGPSVSLASQIVGEAGNPDVDISISPYPTDHRGVVSTFDVAPAEMPALVAVERRRLSVGDTLDVRFHAPGKPGERVAIVPAGGSPAGAVASQSTGGAVDGTLSFATGGLRPRAYEAVLVASNGKVLSRIPFWLYEPGAPTTVTTSKSVYAEGEPLVVSWTNAPGMKWDWLGLYSPGDNDGNAISSTCYAGYCSNGHYLLYVYTRASIEGTAAFDSTAFAGYVTWPVKQGTYEVRLLLDDGYRSVASSAPFKIEPR